MPGAICLPYFLFTCQILFRSIFQFSFFNFWRNTNEKFRDFRVIAKVKTTFMYKKKLISRNMGMKLRKCTCFHLYSKLTWRFLCNSAFCWSTLVWKYWVIGFRLSQKAFQLRKDMICSYSKFGRDLSNRKWKIQGKLIWYDWRLRGNRALPLRLPTWREIYR